MHRPTRLVRHGVAVALATLLVAACGANASPSPSAAATTVPTATPTAEATATPEPTPTETPAATATPDATPEATPTIEPSASGTAVDPTSDLEIAEPYALEPLDDVTAAMLQAGIAEGLGSMSDIVELGAVGVTRDGTDEGFVLAIAFPDFPGVEDPAFFESLLQGAAGSSGGTVDETTIGGTAVGLIDSPSAPFAAYQDGTTVIFVYGQSLENVRAIVEALIEANE